MNRTFPALACALLASLATVPAVEASGIGVPTLPRLPALPPVPPPPEVLACAQHFYGIVSARHTGGAGTGFVVTDFGGRACADTDNPEVTIAWYASVCYHDIGNPGCGYDSFSGQCTARLVVSCTSSGSATYSDYSYTDSGTSRTYHWADGDYSGTDVYVDYDGWTIYCWARWDWDAAQEYTLKSGCYDPY